MTPPESPTKHEKPVKWAIIVSWPDWINVCATDRGYWWFLNTNTSSKWQPNGVKNGRKYNGNGTHPR